MPSEWALIWVVLVITSTICIFERIKVGFTFFCFETRDVYFIIYLVTLCKVVIVFWFMWAVIFNTLHSLNSAWKGSVILFPTVFVLKYSQVHICSLDDGNIVSYIETSINEASCLATTLKVPNIQLHNGHVRLRRNLDNIWFRYEHNIVKDLVLFDNVFNVF